MNLDAEIAKAQERLHRQIGQWHRRDVARRKRHVALHLAEIERAFKRLQTYRTLVRKYSEYAA